MQKVTIPPTIDAAKESLAGLDGLITAKEWERAAIVYAFTRDGGQGEGGPGRKQNSDSAVLLTTGQFAALGIAGLRSDQTVRRHRKAWQDAIDAGKAEAVVPGQLVELPDMPWGEVYVSERREDGRSSGQGTIELPQTKDPVKLREHFEQHPDSASRVAEALPPATRQQITTEETERTESWSLRDRAAQDRVQAEFSRQGGLISSQVAEQLDVMRRVARTVMKLLDGAVFTAEEHALVVTEFGITEEVVDLLGRMVVGSGEDWDAEFRTIIEEQS